MNWKAFTAGTLVGVIGHFVYSHFLNDREITGDEILENVKEAFKKEEGTTVTGAWIQLKKQHYKKYAINTLVYRGGVTTIREGEKRQYEFIVEAKSGALIDVYLT